MQRDVKEYDVAVKVWGEIACFTRPEFKVERVTYPVMTPAAARGVLEAIFWKPEIRYEIREIWVLSPIKNIAIMRNEVKGRQSIRAKEGFFIEDKRQQRTSLFLKDPAYLVLADIRLKADTLCAKKKYVEQFNRRLERGKCFHQPYLGTRECTAYFARAGHEERPVFINMDIGNMLFDIAYCRSDDLKEMEFIEHQNNSGRVVTGFAQPLYFFARIEGGVLTIPWEKYRDLYRLGGKHVKGIG